MVATTPLRRFEIDAYVDRVGVPLYLMWVNGIVFFAGFGGFALFHSLGEDPPNEDIWLFAGAFVAGLAALACLIRHVVILRTRSRNRLIFDENTVTLSTVDHSFNFGMLEFILWDRDYRNGRGGGRFRTRLLIRYRKGAHFEQGEQQSFVFDARTTHRQMADLQEAYFRVMLLNKSRRKFQRENAAQVRDLQAQKDIQGLAQLVQQLSGGSVIEDADIAQSDDPRDKIDAFYSQTPDDATGRLVKTVATVASSRPLALLSGVVGTIIGGIIMLFNLAVLWAILSA